jgi:hypothetical protein
MPSKSPKERELTRIGGSNPVHFSSQSGFSAVLHQTFRPYHIQIRFSISLRNAGSSRRSTLNTLLFRRADYVANGDAMDAWALMSSDRLVRSKVDGL